MAASVETEAPKWKLILAGDAGVGKTTFIKRHITGEFDNYYIPSQGTDRHYLTLNTTKGSITFEMWDTAGRLGLLGLDKDYFSKDTVAIIMFEHLNETSHNNVSKWKSDIVHLAGRIPIVVCGNKVDYYDLCHVNYPKGKTVANFDISVKDGKNIEQPLLYFTRKILSDKNLEFAAVVATPPPEVVVSTEMMKRIEKDVKEAVKSPLPDSDDEELSTNIRRLKVRTLSM